MLLKEIPVGSLVKDPTTKYNGKPIVWRVVGQNINGYPVNSTTLMSNNILEVNGYDAKEPSNSDSGRKTSGNNRWSQSNIRQWLNSDKVSPWYSPSHSTDMPPTGFPNGNSYDIKNGFLNSFGSDFKDRILKTTLKNVLADTDGGGLENTTDSVFLFSMTELGLQGSIGKEGTIITHLSNSGNRRLKPTEEAVNNSVYKHVSLNKDSNFYFWLRTAYPDYGHINYRITMDGTFSQSISNNDAIGIAPALNLDGESIISRQDDDGTYILSFSSVGPADLSSVTFTLKDTVSNKSITTNTKFSSSVKLDWNDNTSNIKFTAKLKKDGSSLNYSEGTELKEYGNYTLVITATDLNFPENKRDSNEFSFSILPPKKDMDNISFVIKDLLSNGNITNNSTFTGEVKPAWEKLQDINYTLTYSLDNQSKGNFLENTIYNIAGVYNVTYVLTDKYYEDNQKSGTVKFTLLNAPVDWNKNALKVRDALTGKPITINSTFEGMVKPAWDKNPNVNYNYTLAFQGSLISYNEGMTLTSVGKYVIKFLLVDKYYPDNSYNEEIPFEVLQPNTDLNNFEPDFVNIANDDEEIISEGEIFKALPVKPYWMELPEDIEIQGYSLTKDGSPLAFTAGSDTFTDEGKYTISLDVINAKGDNRIYDRNFVITLEKIDLDNKIEVYNDLDESTIDEGRIFQEEVVVPTWDDPEDIDVYYTMYQDGEEIEFIKGVTVLTDNADYQIKFILEEFDNTSNSKEETLNFRITDKQIKMTDINVVIVNNVTGQPIQDNDIFKGIAVKPYWFMGALPESLDYESWITFNGSRREYEQGDEDDILTEVGSYVLEVKFIDSNFPENFKIVTRSFSIIAPTKDMSNIQVIIKNKLTDTDIEQGQVFRGDNAAVQPTWTEFQGLKYTYNLTFKSEKVNDYVKGNILRNKGNYIIYVKAEDPNYPENSVESSIAFSIQDSLNNDPDSNDLNDAYLNGLPFELGTTITKTGDYNLMVARRKKSNFKISFGEVNFKIVNPNEDLLPIILVEPDTIPSIKDMVTIVYPDYANQLEYKIGSGEWTAYDEPFEVTDNTTVYARYLDPLDYFVSNSRDITNIDKMPPDPPIILGFKEGIDTYYAVSPVVEYIYGNEYTATLDGKDYILGTPIYNEKEEIREYTLIVTAKKKLNGLTATTIKKFKLDSIPPKAPKIIGVDPDVIQESARPDVLDEELEYEVTQEFRLNGKKSNRGLLIDYPGSYQFSATNIKKVNGLRATSVVSFTIINKIPEPIGPQRLSIEPLTEVNKIKAVDGEMVVDLDSGHFSIYDDGYLISKTRELEELLALLNKVIKKIDIDLQSNRNKIESLFKLRDSLKKHLDILKKRNIEISSDINKMDSILNYLNFIDLTFLESMRDKLSEIYSLTQSNRITIEDLSVKLTGKIEQALIMMNGLQENSSLIGEIIWLKNNQR
ncbi:hypothetical protein Bp8pS_022 [Bacillus phage vB_BpuM-BpSp]|nr:hypothetical protein Bp8pS_022 [Bacillus phage vB_BpuM-BpSp]